MIIKAIDKMTMSQGLIWLYTYYLFKMSLTDLSVILRSSLVAYK